MATVNTEFAYHHCPVCSVLHGLPKDMSDLASKDPGNRAIYCPNGHRWVFLGKSDAQKLREQLDAKERELSRERDRVAIAKVEARRSESARRAWKASATKLKKKITGATA